MVFSSMLFLFIFLPALLIIYFIVPQDWRWLRNLVLLIFSLIFYASNEPVNILVMLASIMANYVLGLCVEYARHKKPFVALAVIANLSVLIYFKYTVFICDNLSHFFNLNLNIEEIIMPVGISFFTFQAMSYVFDIYYGSTKAQKNPLDVMLYISLFPQLVAGPIVRYQTVADEIDDRWENTEEIAQGMQTFIIGLAKKLLIANRVGIIADAAFAEHNINFAFAWLGIVAYTLQIYFDFSAYSDMAIGLGRIFGFHFPENFNYPYISKSVTEFWRRWHISLSVWFRDYLYIPLGGNRCAKWKHLRNIMIVWLATGIWHGASWNFVVWGLYYGIILIIEKEFLSGLIKRLPSVLCHIYTMLIVLIGFVFFRADTLTDALVYLRAMFTFEPITIGASNELQFLLNNAAVLVIALIGCTPVKNIAERLPLKAPLKFIYCMALFLMSVMYLTSSTFNPFIYFRF